MLTSTALVLMMTIPGLALFYGGMVRKKNVLATVMQSFAITCLVTVLWMVVGYSVAFTRRRRRAGLSRRLLRRFLPEWTVSTLSAAGRGEHPRVGLHDLPDDLRHHHAGADRRRLRRTHEVLGAAAVHRPVVARRLLPDRPLGLGRRLPRPTAWASLDFAGGTVVHINAGVAGLVCALVLGKRDGYGHEQHGAAQPRALP